MQTIFVNKVKAVRIFSFLLFPGDRLIWRLPTRMMDKTVSASKSKGQRWSCSFVLQFGQNQCYFVEILLTLVQ